jgi:uncharacterized protein YxeA
MKKIIALIIITVIFTVGCAAGDVPEKASDVNQPATQQNNSSRSQANTGNSNNTPGQENISGNSQQNTGITKVKVFLIAIDDNGKSGKKIGAGDSVIPVEVAVDPTNTPLKAALNKLFSIKDREYGQSGLYNPLYNSNLKLESATIKDGQAEIRISGNLMLGGVLDNPRVKAQIEETALQFSSVKSVLVYLNNKKLDDALSLK